jgi:phosphatidylglycerophosphatase A
MRMTRLAVLLATFGCVGYAPVAPGTAGSLAALVLFAIVRSRGSAALEVAVLLLVSVVGVWAATRAERHFGREDPGAVVIDEVAGTLLTLLLIPVGLWGALAGFLVFRVFDIAKPWPVRRFEELPSGLGIMADDLMAGVYGHVVMRLVAAYAPGMLL